MNETQDANLNLREYLKILKRRRWVMAATLAIVIASAALVSWRMTPIYRGEAKVEVQPVSASTTEESKLLESLIDPTTALQTQVELIKSASVLNRAGKDLDLASTDDLQENLRVDLVKGTQIVDIQADNPSPIRARDWANAVARAYIEFRRDRAVDQALSVSGALGKKVAETQSQLSDIDAKLQDPAQATPSLKADRDSLAGRLTVLQTQLQALPDAEALRRGGGSTIAAAEIPDEPVRPKLILNLALALVVGTALAVGLAFLAENLDDRIRTPEELEARVGAPALGYIPLMPDWEGEDEGSSLATVREPASGAAESYRTLRTNLKFVSLEKPLGVLMVTSAVAEEGKTTTSANVAVAFAQGGIRTILVTADLRRPSAHKLFGASNSKGLVNLLEPNFPLARALQTTEVPNLLLLAAGGIPPNPTELLASSRFGALLARLKKAAELVIIDAPPVLGLGDTSALASRADGILMVVDSQEATRKQVDHAVDQLRKAGGRIIGTVVNAIEAEDGHGYYYQYYYSMYEQDEAETLAPAEEFEDRTVSTSAS